MKTDWLNSVAQLTGEMEPGGCLLLEPDRDEEEKKRDGRETYRENAL